MLYKYFPSQQCVRVCELYRVWRCLKLNNDLLRDFLAWGIWLALRGGTSRTDWKTMFYQTAAQLQLFTPPADVCFFSKAEKWYKNYCFQPETTWSWLIFCKVFEKKKKKKKDQWLHLQYPETFLSRGTLCFHNQSIKRPFASFSCVFSSM